MRGEKSTRRQSKDAVRAAQREWLGHVREATGRTLSKLAVEAGLSNSTLTRFYNRENYAGTLDPTAVQRLSDLTGIAGPGATVTPRPVAELREEGSVYAAEANDRGVVDKLLEGRPHAYAMTMHTDLLHLAGVRAGDVVVIDPTVRPRDGDIVCAQLLMGTGARTIYRVYKAAFLVVASAATDAPPPQIVAGQNIHIVGVMTDLIRRRSD